MPRGRKAQGENAEQEEQNQEPQGGQSFSGNIPAQEEKQETESAPKYPRQVTFVWNRAISERTIIIRPASTRFTEFGAISDPENPAWRITVKGGVYKTSDEKEISALKENVDFNSAGPDGFSIMKELTPQDEVKRIMTQHGLTKEQLLEAIAAK